MMAKRSWGVEVVPTACLCRHPVNGEWVVGHIIGFRNDQARSLIRFEDHSQGWVNDEFVSFEHEQKRLI